jgi:SOS response regulatory protein OraA/RecX
MDDMYHHALKLLSMRDYTAAQLRAKLDKKFGSVDEAVIADLIKRKFLNDRRFVRNFIDRKATTSLEYLRDQLLERGVEKSIVAEELEKTERPSLREVVNATMIDCKLRAPLRPREAARLFRALIRLGYQEDAIREELEPFHEQQ